MADGLDFKKLDLHVHTGGSYDFQGDVTAEDIVNAALGSGLDAIAITDHNTSGWIDSVKQAADGTELVVFPGVEVTCEGGTGGIHIIVLFDPAKDAEYVSGFLGSLDITPEKQGTPEALVGQSHGVTGVIDKADEWGGVAIPAHVNSDKGVLSDMRGEQRTRIVQHPKLLALEATDFHKPTGRRTIDFLDGNDSNYKRKLAVYQASDNRCPDGDDGHCVESIGSRCAYFKMETINLDSLRQCFIDPDVRIRQHDELTLLDYPFVKQINIHSGFLDGQAVDFHRGLNSVLGSKGAGKSLLVEFLRFGLNQEPKNEQIKQDHSTKLKERLGEYGVVRIVAVTETGREIIIERTYRELDDSPYSLISVDIGPRLNH